MILNSSLNFFSFKIFEKKKYFLFTMYMYSVKAVKNITWYRRNLLW